MCSAVLKYPAYTPQMYCLHLQWFWPACPHVNPSFGACGLRSLLAYWIWVIEGRNQNRRWGSPTWYWRLVQNLLNSVFIADSATIFLYSCLVCVFSSVFQGGRRIVVTNFSYGNRVIQALGDVVSRSPPLHTHIQKPSYICIGSLEVAHPA